MGLVFGGVEGEGFGAEAVFLAVFAGFGAALLGRGAVGLGAVLAAGGGL